MIEKSPDMKIQRPDNKRFLGIGFLMRSFWIGADLFHYKGGELSLREHYDNYVFTIQLVPCVQILVSFKIVTAMTEEYAREALSR